MLKPLFSTSFYYQFTPPNVDELLEKIDECKESDINNSEFEWGKECIVDRIPLRWQPWIELLEPSLEHLGKLLNASFNYVMFDPWVNYYKRGSFQEIHDHAMHDMACVFFANSGEDFSKFMILDRNSTNISENMKKLIGYKNVRYVDYKKGDIIFFPGSLLHGVSPHNNDEPRKTFACNFNVEYVSGRH